VPQRSIFIRGALTLNCEGSISPAIRPVQMIALSSIWLAGFWTSTSLPVRRSASDTAPCFAACFNNVLDQALWVYRILEHREHSAISEVQLDAVYNSMISILPSRQQYRQWKPIEVWLLTCEDTEDRFGFVNLRGAAFSVMPSSSAASATNGADMPSGVMTSANIRTCRQDASSLQNISI
jgi:hypothetical protein